VTVAVYIRCSVALHVPELASNISQEASAGPLIGRDAELQQLTRLLGDGVPDNAGARRLVTLYGCHGVGKSALAMALARRLTSRGPGHGPGHGPEGPSFHDAGGGFTPMIVECRGCDGTFGSLASRILAVFGLRHRQPYDTGSCDVTSLLRRPSYPYLSSSLSSSILNKLMIHAPLAF